MLLVGNFQLLDFSCAALWAAVDLPKKIHLNLNKYLFICLTFIMYIFLIAFLCVDIFLASYWNEITA